MKQSCKRFDGDGPDNLNGPNRPSFAFLEAIRSKTLGTVKLSWNSKDRFWELWQIKDKPFEGEWDPQASIAEIGCRQDCPDHRVLKWIDRFVHRLENYRLAERKQEQEKEIREDRERKDRAYETEVDNRIRAAVRDVEWYPNATEKLAKEHRLSRLRAIARGERLPETPKPGEIYPDVRIKDVETLYSLSEV